MSFWQVYKIINIDRLFTLKRWVAFKCDRCGGKCIAKARRLRKVDSIISKSFRYFLWLSPALILIFLVAFKKMNFAVAILLITLYHFWAMYFIIKWKYIKIMKK